MSRQFDIIIFGATGFTGKHCVLQTPKILGNLKWAVAGRDQQKLNSMLQEIGDRLDIPLLNMIPTLVANVENYASLVELAKQCRVLVNCCGPFLIHGEPVVKACIEAKTDYVDVAAEPQFMEAMQLKYHHKAQENNTYSISACGFDSILCEMGLIFAEKNFNGTIHSSEIYIRIRDHGPLLGATVNYGTWHSMVKVFGRGGRNKNVQSDQELFKHPKLKTKLIHKSKVTGNWYVPFANIDQSVSKRTQEHFKRSEQKWPIQIREYHDLGKSWVLPVLAVIYGIFLFLLSRFDLGMKLLLNHPRIFSLGQVARQGPPLEKYETATFEHTFVSKGWRNGEDFANKPAHELITRVSGSNPAYGATCVCVLMSAVTLITERKSVPGR